VVSGAGLVNVHDFLRAHRRIEVPSWLADEMGAGDAAAAISTAALLDRDPVCVEALDLFVQLYGVEAGSHALKIMATGGVYVGGGIAPKILEKLKGPRFMEGFLAKGRMRPLLEAMPVRVILNDRTALFGPALYAAAMAGAAVDGNVNASVARESMDFEYRFTVGMSSVDAAGVMFCPELFRHAHDAYEAFMQSVGHELGAVLAKGHYLLPIRHAEADHLHPMRLGAAFVVHVGVSRIGTTSFTIVSSFVAIDEQLCARSKTVHVCVDTGTGQPMTLPDALRNALEACQVRCRD